MAAQTIRTRQTPPMTQGTFRPVGQRCSPASTSWPTSGISKSSPSPVIRAPALPLSPLAAAAPRPSGWMVSSSSSSASESRIPPHRAASRSSAWKRRQRTSRSTTTASRRVARVYEMSLGDRIWNLWREAPRFLAALCRRVSDDGREIRGAWEPSPDGLEWKHDVDLTYIKIR
jgi:hypothetical protein